MFRWSLGWGEPSGNAVIPLELKVTAARNLLSVPWDDGAVSLIPASILRARSRAAQQVRADIEGTNVRSTPSPGRAQRRIGSYAIRLVFSDGHVDPQLCDVDGWC
ncbi:gamma-butyrobetaine hydroxylase-like domain-containing protein [Mesorhizobium sp. M1169]|uniref:gamma-butyrobetaine hydroxylase-like domain-containing protein n=1 Tax=Mesorhizobium sp. M1169 TaxID=2957066 RepID=UPI003334F028